MYNYTQLERGLEKIFQWLNISRPLSDLANAREYIDAGEYGLAYENMCAIVAQEHMAIPTEILNEFIELGSMMKLDPGSWGLHL